MSISKRLRFEVFKRDSFTCQYCGKRAPDVVLEVDHVHPRCHGGNDAFDNLKTACWECNRGKAGVPLLPAVVAEIPWTCWLGPLDGKELPMPTVDTVHWVMQTDTGEIFTVEDEWVTDGDDRTRDLRYGHPGFGMGPGNRSRKWQIEYQNGTHPKLLGIYHIEDLYRTLTGPEERHLAWWDPERLIVEFTA